MVRLAVLSAGAPRHGRNITKQWQGIADDLGFGWQLDFLEWRNNAYDDYDFGLYDYCIWVGCFERVFEFMEQISGPKHAALWVGTDILQHQGMVAQGHPDAFAAAHIHLADATNLVIEAKELTGLDVGLVRSIPPETYDAVPVGRWDSVLGYVPTGRDDFFRWAWFLELARDYPDVAFHIIGRETKESLPPNVIIHQETAGADKRRLFERCFAYLRPIEHDGIGLTLVEMAQMGRFVFHSDTRIPHVLPARSVGEMEVHLDDIIENHRIPDPRISEHYRREFSDERLRSDLESLRQRLG